MNSKKIIFSVVGVLVCLVLILAYLNRGDLAVKNQLQTDEKFRVIYNDTTYEISMDDLNKIGIEDFTATVDTSTTEPHEEAFKGVEVTKVFEFLDIDVNNVTSLEFKALDGYASAVTSEELLTPENVYIVVEREGEALGTKAEGGSGPYMMIIKSSQFSQRWCKFLQDVVIK